MKGLLEFVVFLVAIFVGVFLMGFLEGETVNEILDSMIFVLLFSGAIWMFGSIFFVRQSKFENLKNKVKELEGSIYELKNKKGGYL